MMSGTDTEAVHEAAEAVHGAVVQETAAHGGEAFNAGETIIHHITDDRIFEFPLSSLFGFGESWMVEFPKWTVLGQDISITKNVVMMWLVSVILLVLFSVAARKAKEPVPRGVRGFLEILILFVRDEIARKGIGKGADFFVPYLLTTFFFILTCNFLGLVPGMATPTSGISVTAGLAIMAFIMIQFAGIKHNGLIGYIQSVIPLKFSWAMLPIIIILIPVEIMGMLVKPFALCVRLFANMTAGHVVILSLISMIFIMETAWMGLVSVPFALFIYLLEILVAFIQAFVFTLLTALFIGMSAHPAH